jgi:Putative beta-barrel porin 2
VAKWQRLDDLFGINSFQAGRFGRKRKDCKRVGGSMRAKLSGLGILVSMALAVGTATDSFAQETAPAGGQGNAPAGGQGNAPAGGQGGASAGGPGIVPTGEYKEGLPLGSWMLFPSVFVGAVYNSNVSQLTTTDNGTDLRIVPRLVGTYDGGIHKTTVYGVVDAEFLTYNNVAADVGFSSTYEAMRDLVFNYYGNYTRETSIFNSAVNFNNGAIGPPGTPAGTVPLVINPFGTTPTVNPIAYNQFTAGGSVNKTFNQAFASLGVTAFYILFDQPTDIPEPFQTSENGASIWVTGRVGYNVIPQLYVFAEGDGIFQRFANSVFNTDGYRVMGGLGTKDPNSLIQGEIYGGYQAQQQLAEEQFGTPSIPLLLPSGIPTFVSSGVFGGRLSYYPTQYWTLVGSVDQVLGISTQLSPGVPEGLPSKVTTALVQTTYALAHNWWVGARGGYTQGYYFGLFPQNDGFLAGASFNYEIWRNLLTTLDYQFTTLKSDVSVVNFNQHTVTAGFTYRY